MKNDFFLSIENLFDACGENLNLTNEQIKIINYAVKTKKNILVEARAGSGKTTTIAKIFSLLPEDLKCIFISFNVHNKEELERKLSDCDKKKRIATSYSIGYNSILGFLRGTKPVIEENKYVSFIEKYVNMLIKNSLIHLNSNDEVILIKDKNEKNYGNVLDFKTKLKKLINLYRLYLCGNNLSSFQSICKTHGLDVDKFTFGLISSIVNSSVKNFNDKNDEVKIIDYVDMIYFPLVLNLKFHKYDVVITDEFQDYSIAQYEIARRSRKSDGKFVTVGDPFQSLYQFNGADPHVYEKIKNEKNTISLKLTYTFRCAKKIVEEAKIFVSDIKAMENASEGKVEFKSVLEAKYGDWVLCRYNFPLFKLFFDYHKKGINSCIKGKDYNLLIQDVISFYKNKSFSIHDMMDSLNKELKHIYREIKNKDENPEENALFLEKREIINGIKYLNENSVIDFNDINETFRKMNLMFKEHDQNQCVVLSTVHKSKGLENDVIYYIVHRYEIENGKFVLNKTKQDFNINYVAITRAKKELYYDVDYYIDIIANDGDKMNK